MPLFCSILIFCFRMIFRHAGIIAEKQVRGEGGIQIFAAKGGDVVHGYDGVLNAEAENGIFLISVLMPFPDAAHDIKTAV